MQFRNTATPPVVFCIAPVHFQDFRGGWARPNYKEQEKALADRMEKLR